jgi:hypothetical protein
VSRARRLSLLVGTALVVLVGASGRGEAQVVVGGGFYFGSPFWYGYPWYYGYPTYPYALGGYPYGHRVAPHDSALRLEVTPKEAEVYVDGYYAGVVDDFDGAFQRLRVAPGQHELALYREGYRTTHQTVNLSADSTFKVRFNMEKLAPGDVAEPRPIPAQQPAPAISQPPPNISQPPPPNQPGLPQSPPAGGRSGRRGAPLPPSPAPDQGAPRTGNASAYGTLAVRVQPGSATVTIDGDRWAGPEGQDRLLVELAEGTHHVQIERDGFESYSSDVTIRRGETTPLNVSLRTR